MFSRISFQSQFFFGLLTALMLGWIYDVPSAKTTEQRMTHPPSFENLSGGWRVEVRFYSDKPPEILEIQALEEIRLTPVNDPGDYFVTVLDKNGQELFNQQFNVYFLRTGSSVRLSTVDITLVIPYFNNVAEIVIRSPHGDLYHAIP